MASASVVVPAHDEAAVIGRSLRALLDGAGAGELEVVVVCNGCTDGTASAARAAAPEATVVEIEVASKAAALNEGDRVATTFPRLYVDADVELPIAATRATIAALEGGALCAAPAAHHDTAGRSWVIRRFYDVHQRIPYFSGPGAIGNGVYALSAEARRRFDRFPDLTADDQFVLERFTPTERRTVRPHSFTIRTPRSLRGLLKVRTRSYRGNLELGAAAPAPPGEAHTSGAFLRTLLRDRRVGPGVPVWLAVNAVAKANARRRWNGTWERDETSRSGH
jgi:glycosyltransferase involved in cell wall biosynthesis